MRDILFRGKRKDNGEWIEGYYAKATEAISDKEVHVIFPLDLTLFPRNEFCSYVEIIPGTNYQFTGLTDKNGKKIFEGDAVKAKVIVNKMSGSKKYDDIYEVAYHPNYCYFYLKKKGNNLLFDGNWSYGVTIEEVIGNIHDNPELLEDE